MSSDQIILYDLPSKPPCKSWSLNPWKTRLLLNYKGIPYKTEWVEYPDIEPKFKSSNIPQHPPNTNMASYTIPAICLPTGEYIMDSLAIARHLESLHLTPSLHLESPYLDRTLSLLAKAQAPLAPVFTPRIPRMLLNERSAEYFHRTRQARFGMPLDEFEKGPKGGKVAWEAAEPHLKEIAAMLREDGSGPYFMGKEVSYADLLLVAFMKMFDRIELLENVLAADKEAFGGVYEGCKQWLERDDQ